MSDEKTQLSILRDEIDRIDNAIHDLLMERSLVVEQVRAAKGPEGIKLRPGREAQVLRRLISRHKGPFPKGGLVRIWREIMSAYLKLQGHLSMAVYMPNPGAGFWDLARDQYGSQTPMSAHELILRIVEDVRRGGAAIGVLPLPYPDDNDPWWRFLVDESDDTPRIVSRLPVASTEKVRGQHLEALVIGQPTEDHTDDERYYNVIESDGATSPKHLLELLASLGIEATLQGQWNTGSARLDLIETAVKLDGQNPLAKTFRQKADPIVKRIVYIGGYASQFTAAQLD